MRKILSGLFAFCGAGLALLMQVGPHDAATNFCNWMPFWQPCQQSLSNWFDRWAWTFPTTLLGAALILCLSPFAIRVLRRPGGRPRSRPDWPIFHVIDYVVNDSKATLKQPRKPWIEEYGPFKGRRMIEGGVEHMDALNNVNTMLVDGRLQIWGHREIPSHIAFQFENLLREIPKSYWEHWTLHPLMCFHESKTRSQTVLIPGHLSTESGYSGLMLCRQQVQFLWTRKSAWRRLTERLRRKQRITYWPKLETIGDSVGRF